MSEHNLIKVAIQHFLKFGYEGTKLSHIAQEAGMKKQSLYFHYVPWIKRMLYWTGMRKQNCILVK